MTQPLAPIQVRRAPKSTGNETTISDAIGHRAPSSRRALDRKQRISSSFQAPSHHLFPQASHALYSYLFFTSREHNSLFTIPNFNNTRCNQCTIEKRPLPVDCNAVLNARACLNQPSVQLFSSTPVSESMPALLLWFCTYHNPPALLSNLRSHLLFPYSLKTCTGSNYCPWGPSEFSVQGF